MLTTLGCSPPLDVRNPVLLTLTTHTPLIKGVKLRLLNGGLPRASKGGGAFLSRIGVVPARFY